MSLILWTGARTASLDEIRDITTPEPTSTHKPLPHMDLIDELDEIISNVDATLVESTHALTHSGRRYFGLFELESNSSSDWNVTVGLRNSHDKSAAAGMCLGQKVMVCTNLAFSGEIKFARKHTANCHSDTMLMMRKAFTQVPRFENQLQDRDEKWKNLKITNGEASTLILKSAASDIIPQNKITHVHRHWEQPEYNEFSKNGHSVYRLFNSFTSAMRPSVPSSGGEANSNANIFTHFERTVGLTKAFEQIAKAKDEGKKLDVMKNASEVMQKIKVRLAA